MKFWTRNIVAALLLGLGCQAWSLAQEPNQTVSSKTQPSEVVPAADVTKEDKKSESEFNPIGHTIYIKEFPGCEPLSDKRIVFAKGNAVAGDFFRVFADTGALQGQPKWTVQGRRVVIGFSLEIEGEKRDCRAEVSIKGMQAGKSKIVFVTCETEDEAESKEFADIQITPTKHGEATPIQLARNTRRTIEVTDQDVYRFQQMQAINRQRMMEQQRYRSQMQYENLRRQAEMEAQEEANRALRDFNYRTYP
jgi:hypothetical protein